MSQKPLRSCDSCRQRKVRCDGPTMPGQRCGHCMTAGQQCTYLKPVSKPGPKNKLVQELRDKVAELEAKLRDLSVCSICSQSLSTLESGPKAEIPEQVILEAEEADVDTLASQFRQWQISTGFNNCKPHFFGPASNVNLLQNLLVLKARHPERSSEAPSSRHNRAIYSDQLPWEKERYSSPLSYVFPANDLLKTLVELYFENVHPTFPVLHRNSFLQHLGEGLHRMDPRFGAVVLAVLALGSRYSDDPRVMLEGNTLSSGWPFVSQLRAVVDPSECTVYHLQFYCLMTLYSMGASTRPMVWLYLGLGIACVRYHGRYPRTMKSEEELWNRAFWSIFILDGLLSCFLGRAPAIDLDEYDVEPPLEIDDEYWDQGFVQPLGKPSTLSFFVRFVGLFEILGKTLRRLYAPKRMRTTAESKQQTVIELDSAMNAFLDTLPPHLHWDPLLGQGVFFDQSAVLHATFHWLQITIHRPYMLTRTAHPVPSLFICLSAARSALNIADVWISRSQRLASNFIQNSTFISAVIILLKNFVNPPPRRIDVEKDLVHVQTAVKIFKSCESRSHSAGILWEVLQDMTEYRVESQSRDDSDLTAATMDLWPADPLDQELLSLWLAAPIADFMNVDWNWDSYVESENVGN